MINYLHALVLFIFAPLLLVNSAQDNLFELSIIHFSDFHSRYVPVSPKGGLCYEKEKCVGGIARVATMAKQLKQSRPNAIFLNSGDCFQGTLYYDLFRGNITAHFMNELPHDAITIGNHDFDDQITGFESYLKQLKAPVVVTNIDQSQQPLLENLYTNSTILHRAGQKIGVIGVLFNETNKMSKTTGKLKFLNEVDTVNLEAQKLKANGVDIIIVLSHCGISHDKIMAKSCPDVDVIVGGHSHILMYNGIPPNNDEVYGKYPIEITQDVTNRKVLIVHPGAFTKYMGNLSVTFDEHGEVAQWSGNPIYLDQSVEEDPRVQKELQPWTEQVDKVGKKLIGETKIYLNGTCDAGECNLADLVADGMVDLYRDDLSIALVSALNIQNSIPAGPIVYEDIFMTLPYNNTWDTIELQGKHLWQALEDSVSGDVTKLRFSYKKLLQFSGLKVVYKLSNPGAKVICVKTRHGAESKKEKYTDIDKNRWYKIAIQSYLVSSIPTISKNHRNHIIGKTFEVENLVNYIKKLQVITHISSPRMVFE